MQRIFLFALFLCLHWVAWGQESYEYRYWFDYEDAERQTGTLLSGEQQLSIDLTGLNDALHAFRFQVKNSEGVWSVPVTRHFLKMPTIENCTTYYWFDDDAIRHELNNAVGSNVIDVSHLKDGIHLIYFQTDGKSSLSSIITRMFIKIPQTVGIDYLNCVCYIDGQLYKQEHVASNNGAVAWNFDVSSLPLGLHRIQLQVITPSGVATNIADRFFFRTTTTKELESMQLVYCLDGTTFEVQKGTAVDGVFHFDVDVASLTDGLHTISYMLSSNTGTSTRLSNAFFWKIPVGGYGIKSYSYWLNDNEANAQVKVLDNRVSSFSLVSLLPVESVPIRSSCFHFEVSDGVPTMFAKNDFHIVFYDASNRRVDETKQFVDYNVSQAVEGITDLQPTQTFERPQENTVKWFTFEGAKGDSVSFASSLATSLQLFDEAGNVLYETSGSESVVTGGTHLLANGTYYLAVHDVTGTKSNQIKLDFIHLDKFDLYSTSKPEFGVLPCVQILELDGNGFDNLKSATLSMGDQVITADSIACIDKSQAKIYMKFSGEETYGDYDLKLYFDDGEESRTITRKQYVSLTEPEFKEIGIEISDPRSVADPYPMTIKLTNNSNISYQAVPFYFGVDHVDKMESVSYMDFAVGASKEMIDNGMQMSFTFENFRGNNSPTAIVPTIIPEVMPGQTLTFTLGVKTGNHQTFNGYAWTGTPWNLLGPEVRAFINENHNGGSSLGGILNGCSIDPCDLAGLAGDLEECACATVLSLGGTLGGIQNALQNMHNRAMREQLAASGLFSDPDDIFPSVYLPSPGDLLWYWLQHCLPGKAGEVASAYDTAMDILNSSDCPIPATHGCNAYNPGDPNEMHGYVSASGSKFVPSEVKDVYYSIEFENNPEIANASAHRIVVCDTLDAQIFDLSSFKPTKVQIGDRIMNLDGEQNFSKTMDMRPEIYAIAQVDLAYDEKTGIAQWTISSLDPMTMEETFDIMQGVLPVNSDGNGLGFLNFDISLKNEMADGATFSNKAGIVFDYEETIMTPLWVNTVDAVSPTSRVVSLQQQNDTILTVNVEGADERSGVWKYEVYAQYGKEAPWWKIGECTADSAQVDFRYYNGIDYGFCVLATDSAGNVEDKELVREANIQTFKAGDVNGDDEVNAFDVMLVQSKYLGQDVQLNVDAADVNGDGEINVFDTILIQDIYLSTVTMNARRFNVVRQRKQKVE